MECSICLQTVKLPYKLPCHHSFCYLCLKFAIINIRPVCPLCRQPVPESIIREASINDIAEDTGNNEDAIDVKWFYRGRHHGYWQFDPDANQELEVCYQDWLQQDSPNIDDTNYILWNDEELLAAGYYKINIGQIYPLYINFEKMYQYNMETGAIRKIRRDSDSFDIIKKIEGIHGIKGIAGLRNSGE